MKYRDSLEPQQISPAQRRCQDATEQYSAGMCVEPSSPSSSPSPARFVVTLSPRLLSRLPLSPSGHDPALVPRSTSAQETKRSVPVSAPRRRVLVLVDESNVTSSAKVLDRKLDWLRLRDFLVQDRELIEMVIYAGLPPAMTEWQAERDRKNKFLHWLRSHGFLVMTKDGAPGAEAHYKANVDVLMAIDAVELSAEMRPEVVILVTGDADFADLALRLRRRGIRVEVASTALTLGAGLKTSANAMIDLTPLLETFDPLI
jgi:uncharacterized LabA/DUF88 family protein